MEGSFLPYGNRLCIGMANLLGNFIMYVARGSNLYTEVFLRVPRRFSRVLRGNRGLFRGTLYSPDRQIPRDRDVGNLADHFLHIS